MRILVALALSASTYLALFLSHIVLLRSLLMDAVMRLVCAWIPSIVFGESKMDWTIFLVSSLKTTILRLTLPKK